ncbi:hypothetical protein [Paraflavitalea speifideaquila]|uniref:hypothetical protein n=1 Tax=Paraflavitalea speifideaquila TaxID=3076558 RepID=UPI0028E55C5A|nr:hypothetical protein [Paraflavitalea speifideiaquila]
MDPPYLRLERPAIDYVQLARAFGITVGEKVETPGAVKAAIEKGIDHVLQTKSSYILDMRIAQDTPSVPAGKAALGAGAAISQHYLLQPGLDVFHANGAALKSKSKAGEHENGTTIPANMPVLF